MPRNPKREKADAETLAPIPAEVLNQIVRDGPLTAAEVEAASRRFKKALIERALGAELTHHLGYAPGAAKLEAGTNHRNGTSGKTVLTDDGPLASMGLPLLDSPDLVPLSAEAARQNRWEFMLVVAPHVIPGGTGQLVNPLAMF